MGRHLCFNGGVEQRLDEEDVLRLDEVEAVGATAEREQQRAHLGARAEVGERDLESGGALQPAEGHAVRTEGLVKEGEHFVPPGEDEALVARRKPHDLLDHRRHLGAPAPHDRRACAAAVRPLQRARVRGRARLVAERADKLARAPLHDLLCAREAERVRAAGDHALIRNEPEADGAFARRRALARRDAAQVGELPLGLPQLGARLRQVLLVLLPALVKLPRADDRVSLDLRQLLLLRGVVGQRHRHGRCT